MKKRNKKGGQTTLEFAIALVLMLAVMVALGSFVYVFKGHGARVLDLVSSEYP